MHSLTTSPPSDTIGYDIRPSGRRQGHATAMLAAALPVAGGLGISPALATVRLRTLAGRKVIEANGGRLIHQRDDRLYFHLPTGGDHDRATTV
ncbi:putative acetyltransferase [Streptosporangium album]|uniref:Putative acetyltransferase n=1 Tax=Streptosporangium album TaxID=47479 RepID=A0A7W7RVG6_9ACTN|nr:hypothetical protein [Streptosporangium album]MBB4938974.1 putative acetyltransferase [Streptosporangium album]